MEHTDEQLVRLTVAGRPAAYGELARRWFRRVLALCHARLYCLADAEDAAQETFLRGYTEISRLQSPERFGPWLRSIATHVCIDRLRAPRRRGATAPSDLEHLSGNGAAPDRRLEADEERGAVLRQIEALPEELREVILLHYYDAMTYDQMAAWLGVARATVNDRLARGREILRRQLLPLAEGVP